MVDCLPNLQLLGGGPNVEKRAKLPTDWLTTAFSSADQRAAYMHDNDLDGLPVDLVAFLDFYDQRKELMRQRLLNMLGVTELASSRVSELASAPGTAASPEG